MEGYDKFMLMDIDMLVVRQGLDDLLINVPAPAAMPTGQYDHGHKNRMDGRVFFQPPRQSNGTSIDLNTLLDPTRSWGKGSGINAGLMIL